MINLWKIEEAKKKLVDEFRPKKIYVFGSYAWGSPTEDSDLDLMIIMNECNDRLTEMRRGIRALRGIGFSKDIIVESEEEFLINSKDINKIESEIFNRGYLIYENAN